MNNFLDKMTNFVDSKLTPPLIKFGNNKYMVAIRNALIRLIPLLIVGSFPMILTNLPIASLAKVMAPYNDALNTLSNMTFGFISLFLAFGIGSELADTYGLDKTTVGIVSSVCFLLTVAPLDLKTNTISVGGFGASGMFTTFVIGIIVAEVMHFCDKHNIDIKMPAGVPAGIASSFSSILPMTVLFVFFWFLRIIIGFDLNGFLKSILSPILILSDTWYAVLLVGLVLMLCWSVGIHGGSMTVQGVMYAFLVANIALNVEQVAAGMKPTHVLTEPFVFCFGMPTGNGITLPLVLTYLFSKSKRLRSVSRMSLIPSIFNINEPVVFGLPVVMNPTFFLPYVFGTTVFGMMYGFVLIRLGLMTAPYISVPWTTPPLLYPYLATGGDWRAVVAQLVLFIIVGLVWYPFAKAYEKQLLKEEQLEND